MDTEQHTRNSYALAYLGWAAVGIFYFYQYILRVSPGVMIEDLRREFTLTAEQFSYFGSFYLYAYALLQVPLGIIVDKIGVKKTVLGSILLCLMGTFLMAQTSYFSLALVSRILIGAGSATAFMCCLKIIADGLPPGKRALLMGATLALGTVGALTAGKPLVFLLDNYGWRTSLNYTSLVGLLCFMAAFFVLPKQQQGDAHPHDDDEHESTWARLIEIVKNKQIVLYALLAIGVYTPLSALADLWGTAFLSEKFGLSRGDAAQTTMMLYVGLASGSLIIPWISEHAHALNRTIRYCTLGLLITSSIIIFGPAFSKGALTVIMLLVGVFCGAEMICFTGALLHTTPANSGLTIGVVNTFNMLGGAILQQLIGSLLDMQWTGLVDEFGVRQYTPGQYIIALSSLTVIIAACFLISFKLKRYQYNDK